ncbi:MAG: archaetidylserine decarboxylase, partial [Thermoanaerobaculia bacterium]|nr:archaetidylserine decarboxylase [Thermoanaerobaculia bacterium]
LREGLRPIESDLVSPVDGVLRNFGAVEEGRLEQIKGKTYTLARFLGEDEAAKRYEQGVFFNLYLSPQDYHHVHAPVGGRVTGSAHIPGMLWPVNDWSLANIDELFSINERVITWIESDLGRVAVVMIGATNVGSMSVTYDSFITNTARTRKTVISEYETPIPIETGAKLGTFHMGSSVVALFEPGRVDLDRVRVKAGDNVHYGQAFV